jgi:hypothetical protein
MPMSPDVDERMAYRPGRGQRPRVEAVAPDPAAPAERAIHRTGDADGEAAHAAREARTVVGLDQQVEMAVLRGELDDAEARVRGGAEGMADGGRDPMRAEAADGVARAQRDVDGMFGPVLRSHAMGNPRASAGGTFAPGAAPAATPGRRMGKTELLRTSHHDLNRLLL